MAKPRVPNTKNEMNGVGGPAKAITRRARRVYGKGVTLPPRKGPGNPAWTKGKSGNPLGQAIAIPGIEQVWKQARAMAVAASPDAMRVLIELFSDPKEDGRVRSVAAVAVLDRAGIRPVEKLDKTLEPERVAFDPRQYTSQDIAIIEAGLKLMLAGSSAETEAEIIPPVEASADDEG